MRNENKRDQMLLKPTLLWAQEFLGSNGYELQDEPFIVKEVPWSKITCFTTDRGLIYLKFMAKPFAKEAILLQFLFNHVTKSVTEVIASNEELSCFLMKDAGEVLRKIQKENFKADYLCQLLDLIAKIQITSIQHVDSLLTIGINDWRLARLPDLYANFVSQIELLTEDGLTLPEIKNLQKLSPKIQILCEKLSSYNISETIEHGDFHDNNALIQGNGLTISDWGDSSISHPFFSCASALNSAKRHHHLVETDPVYVNALKVYLEQWKNYGTENELHKAFEIAQLLTHIIFSLNFSRIKFCPGIEKFPEYNGYIAGALREFVKQRFINN